MKKTILIVLGIFTAFASFGQQGNFTKVNVRDSVVSLNNDTDLNLYGKGTGKVNIEGNYTLPSQDGTAGQAPVTDGAGTLTFQDIPTSADGITVDDTDFKVQTGDNVQEVLLSIDTALLNARSTGIRFGGVLSINGGDPATFDVTAGAAQILDDTDPENPTFQEISWTAKTGVSLVTTPGVTYLYFDDDTDVLKQTTTAPTRENRRTRIWLGRVVYIGSSIAATANDRDFSQQYAAQLREVAEAIGLVKLNGLLISSNGANLEFNRSAGTLFDFGSNGQDSPHSKDFLSESPVDFFYLTQNAQVGSSRTTIDPNNYDVGGVVTSVTTNRYTIQNVYFFSSGNVRVQYGQNQYTSLADAINSLDNRSLATGPNTELGILLGYIIVKQGTISLENVSNADIINTNKLGGLGGGISSEAGALIAANNLSDLTDVSAARTNLGLGDMAVQNSSSVSITGGDIDGVIIGATTPGDGNFVEMTGTINSASTTLPTANTSQGLRLENTNSTAGAFTDIHFRNSVSDAHITSSSTASNSSTLRFVVEATGSPTVALNIDPEGTTTFAEGMEVQGDLDVTSTGSVKVSNGTTAQRPTGENGDIRYNTTLSKMEAYEDGVWKDMITGTSGFGIGTNELAYGDASGGIISISNLQYRNPLDQWLDLQTSSTTNGNYFLARRTDNTQQASIGVNQEIGAFSNMVRVVGNSDGAAIPALGMEANTDTDTGAIPVMIFNSEISNATLSTRPTLAGYNYSTKQWEVSASGTWDYQGNNLSEMSSISRTGALTINGTTGINAQYNGTTELSVESGLVEVQNDFQVLGNSSFGGNFTAQRIVHIRENQSSGVFSTANQVQLVIEDDSRPGIQLVGNNGNVGSIRFGNESTSNEGQFLYNHSNTTFNLEGGTVVMPAYSGTGTEDAQFTSTGALTRIVSDSLYKHTIEPLTVGLSFVLDMAKATRSYYWKDTDLGTNINWGWTAQAAVKECGETPVFRFDPMRGTYGWDSKQMIAPLYNAIAEQQDEIEAQQAEIDYLSGIVSELTERINILENE